MAKPWSRDAVRKLIDGVGTYGIRHFQRAANAPGDWPGAIRSRKAVYAAARRHCGRGGLTRGVFTLRRFIEQTGYDRSQLLRARRALGQKWRRLGRGGSYLITEDQATEILEWLKHDYWAPTKRLYRCLGCEDLVRPHYALGLCLSCYGAYRRHCRRLSLPATVRGQRAILSRTVLDKNGGYDKILERVEKRLQRGLALDAEQLDWLYAVV